MLQINPTLPSPRFPTLFAFAAKAVHMHRGSAAAPLPPGRYPEPLDLQVVNSGGFRCNLVLNMLNNNSCQWFHSWCCNWGTLWLLFCSLNHPSGESASTGRCEPGRWCRSTRHVASCSGLANRRRRDGRCSRTSKACVCCTLVVSSRRNANTNCRRAVTLPLSDAARKRQPWR